MYSFYLLTLFLEREKYHLLLHLLMTSLVDSCMCPDWEPNLQPKHFRTMLKTTELFGKGPSIKS